MYRFRFAGQSLHRQAACRLGHLAAPHGPAARQAPALCAGLSAAARPRPYSSSGSSSADEPSAPSSEDTTPSTSRKLLSHSSPLDFVRPASPAEPVDDVPPPRSLGSSTVLDQLGISVDPRELANTRVRSRGARSDRGPRKPSSRDFDRSAAPPRRSRRAEADDDDFGFVSLSGSDSPSPSNTPRDRERASDRPRREYPRSGNGGPRKPLEVPTPMPDRWDPSKKLPRSAMDRIRFLHEQDPKTFSVAALSTSYRIGFESVKRILRSKFVPSPDRAREMDDRRADMKKAWRAHRAREVQAQLVRERRELVELAKQASVEEEMARKSAAGRRVLSSPQLASPPASAVPESTAPAAPAPPARPPRSAGPKRGSSKNEDSWDWLGGGSGSGSSSSSGEK
ncbi:Required for respiratory growth protein 9 mitochondrial [Blastocladiella emersonii ATCC 22665]|nr:Required for respiratory growth protein 9 mitochondrial [Blastocladiella emersonii ATCC 22665]